MRNEKEKKIIGVDEMNEEKRKRMKDIVWILYQTWKHNEMGCFSCGETVGLDDTEERLGIYTSENKAKERRDYLIENYSRQLDSFRIEKVEVK